MVPAAGPPSRPQHPPEPPGSTRSSTRLAPDASAAPEARTPTSTATPPLQEASAALPSGAHCSSTAGAGSCTCTGSPSHQAQRHQVLTATCRIRTWEHKLDQNAQLQCTETPNKGRGSKQRCCECLVHTAAYRMLQWGNLASPTCTPGMCQPINGRIP
jgi:hypothetical protein